MDDFKQLELKIKDYKIKELKSLNKILLYFLNNLSIGNERQKDISSSYQLKEIKANVNHFYKELDKRIYTDILDLLNKENIYYKNQKEFKD
jgi:hypothetical protein